MRSAPSLLPAPRPGSLLALLGALALVACGGNGTSGSDVGGTGGSSSSASTSGTGGSSTTGTGGSASVDRGPTVVPVDGDPNGLWWDAATGTLYLADNDNNRILQWTDAGGIALVAELPAVQANGPGLGQLVKMNDGTIVVTRFGFGTVGDVVAIAPDQTATVVPNLDPTRRRVGLTVTAEGTLYDTYFVKTATGDVGVVGLLDLAGTEVDYVTGLDKPIGVLAQDTRFVISDQGAGTLVQAPFAAPDEVAIIAQLEGPDLLCEGPLGSVFSGGEAGEIRLLSSSGELSTFAAGFLGIRGVAYDAAHNRLFAAEHDPKGKMNALHILPVD